MQANQCLILALIGTSYISICITCHGYYYILYIRGATKHGKSWNAEDLSILVTLVRGSFIIIISKEV